MPVPFKVKAVFEYRSDEPDDLNFENGQIITVIEDDDADWYTGEYVDTAGQKVDGIFPRNFVEKYEPVIPSRPARAPRRPVQPEAVEAEPTPAPISPPAVASSATSPPAKVSEVETRTEPKEPAAPEPATRAAEPDPTPLPPKPTPTESKTTPAKKPPPVAEKPSSFKDRIAAFNKPAAAPVTPFKPSGAGTGTGFVKKAFVAPPPSRNAYVPPPREPPPQKIYRREEDPEASRDETEERTIPPPPPPVASAGAGEDSDDQPKPTSLKDRIALLQKQQLEQAAKHAESVKKKEKPKRPAKPRGDSAEAAEEPIEPSIRRSETNDTLSRKSVNLEQADEDEIADPGKVSEASDAHGTPLPSRELVSDTNDADDSGAGDTEDAQDLSTEEELAKPKSVKSLPVETPVQTKPETEEPEEEEGTEEEEEDPEIRRRRELRDRMAKMSGGMGMMGMFGGGGMPAPARKPKPSREERPAAETQHEEEATRAPPVPIMALPGMSNMKAHRQEVDSESDQEGTAQPTPMESSEVRERDEVTDYVAQKPSRKSTERSLTASSQDRAPPPPPLDRPEPPQSPTSRPVPPPPPPTKAGGELPLMQDQEEESDEDPRPAPPPLNTRPPPPSVPGGTRAVPPPPPGQPQSPKATVSSEAPRAAPPVPLSPTSPQSRPPPPPPPGQAPSRRSTMEEVRQPRDEDDSEAEVTEYDGDYDTDIASSAKHKDALKSHNRGSSGDDGVLTDDASKDYSQPPSRAVPPLPPTVPRDVPPPPPPQSVPKSRKSVDAPRAPPPPVPPPKSPNEDDEDEYDPYRYTGPQHGLPGMVTALRSPTEVSEPDDMYDATPQATRVPPPPSERPAPPPPAPTDRPAPPPMEEMTMSGGLAAPERSKQSMELGRSSTISRRSADAPRASNEHGFIASDIDLAQSSMWWTQENNPPPSLQGRSDVLYEVESSTSQKRGGKTQITRDVYILYQDYSQTTVNANYDPAEPGHATLEQNHERPPIPPRKDQLENAWESFGSQIARAAEKASGNAVGEGTAQEFVLSLLRPLTAALMPVGTRSFGAIVYTNLANASTQQFDEIRPGDIITFRNAKFAGHKGGLHSKYSLDVGKPDHVAVVLDWDGTKKKIRAWEQGNQEKGKKSKVREESYRVADLKSGEIRVFRVMPRSYVNWGTS